MNRSQQKIIEYLQEENRGLREQPRGATFVTLLPVPCGYLVLEDIAWLFRRRRPEAHARSAAPAAIAEPGKAA